MYNRGGYVLCLYSAAVISRQGRIGQPARHGCVGRSGLPTLRASSESAYRSQAGQAPTAQRVERLEGGPGDLCCFVHATHFVHRLGPGIQ